MIFVRKKLLLFVLIAIVLLILYFTFPIFESVNYTQYQQLCNYLNESSNEVYYKLKYTVSTGASWAVEDCSDKSMIGEHIAVESVFDPRFLKINENFWLDVSGYLIVKSGEKKLIDCANESVWCINAKKIYVYIPDLNTLQNCYTASDMSLIGMLKMIFGIVYIPLRYSY